MYTFILITLGLLAILGIVVGVSNDAEIGRASCRERV